MSGGPFSQALWWDVRYALRAMRNNALFSTVVVRRNDRGLGADPSDERFVISSQPHRSRNIHWSIAAICCRGVAGSYIPASRAAGIDPLVTLRI
jgi:hypothetical protein